MIRRLLLRLLKARDVTTIHGLAAELKLNEKTVRSRVDRARKRGQLVVYQEGRVLLVDRAIGKKVASGPPKRKYKVFDIDDLERHLREDGAKPGTTVIAPKHEVTPYPEGDE